MIVKHLQTAWNQTRRRVTWRLVWFQAVCHSANKSSKILSKLIEIYNEADDNLFSSVKDNVHIEANFKTLELKLSYKKGNYSKQRHMTQEHSR